MSSSWDFCPGSDAKGLYRRQLLAELWLVGEQWWLKLKSANWCLFELLSSLQNRWLAWDIHNIPRRTWALGFTGNWQYLILVQDDVFSCPVTLFMSKERSMVTVLWQNVAACVECHSCDSGIGLWGLPQIFKSISFVGMVFVVFLCACHYSRASIQEVGELVW